MLSRVELIGMPFLLIFCILIEVDFKISAVQCFLLNIHSSYSAIDIPSSHTSSSVEWNCLLIVETCSVSCQLIRWKSNLILSPVKLPYGRHSSLNTTSTVNIENFGVKNFVRLILLQNYNTWDFFTITISFLNN